MPLVHNPSGAGASPMITFANSDKGFEAMKKPHEKSVLVKAGTLSTATAMEGNANGNGYSGPIE